MARLLTTIRFGLVTACSNKRYKSGRGQPHSKTLRREQRAEKRGSVLECGCPLPLSGVSRIYAITHQLIQDGSLRSRTLTRCLVLAKSESQRDSITEPACKSQPPYRHLRWHARHCALWTQSISPQPGHTHFTFSLLMKRLIPDACIALRFSIMLMPYLDR